MTSLKTPNSKQTIVVKNDTVKSETMIKVVGMDNENSQTLNRPATCSKKLSVTEIFTATPPSARSNSKQSASENRSELSPALTKSLRDLDLTPSVLLHRRRTMISASTASTPIRLSIVKTEHPHTVGNSKNGAKSETAEMINTWTFQDGWHQEPKKTAEALSKTQEVSCDKKKKNSRKSFYVKESDESTILALTPVRLARKKDQKVVGAEFVITPVRRSVRINESENNEWNGQDAVRAASVRDLLSETGFAYSPSVPLKM